MIKITIDTIRSILLNSDNPIKKSRVYGVDEINSYILLESLNIRLTNGETIHIPKKFIWDLSSTPRILWSVFSPDSDAEIAYLVHDFLYQNKKELRITKEFADIELYKWAIETNGTNKRSIRNWDNKCRYLAVKYFGRKSWNNEQDNNK